VTIKELHVLTPILLLLFIGMGLLFLLQLRVPAVAAMFIPNGLASVWAYYDSRTLRLRYPREWERAELSSPFWLGVTTLIFAPLGLPLYTYELRALNNTLKNGVC
jgi:ABC-type multidrug transport system fused ATPase/permease subunit